jgi:hypothetical protein
MTARGYAKVSMGRDFDAGSIQINAAVIEL